jgi:hypothetical protein
VVKTNPNPNNTAVVTGRTEEFYWFTFNFNRQHDTGNAMQNLSSSAPHEAP